MSYTQPTTLTHEQQTVEVYDRVKRIETKVTNYLNAIGFETNCAKCAWQEPNKVIMPSMRASLIDILDCVPDDIRAATVIEAWCKERCVMVFYKSAKPTVLSAIDPGGDPRDVRHGLFHPGKGIGRDVDNRSHASGGGPLD
jgi:hypothetical protein